MIKKNKEEEGKRKQKYGENISEDRKKLIKLLLV